MDEGGDEHRQTNCPGAQLDRLGQRHGETDANNDQCPEGGDPAKR
jgi:hypothetical protein